MNDAIVWESARLWLIDNESRRMVITHGGDGGTWYCLLDDAYESFDGIGDSAVEAVKAALVAMGEAHQ